MTLLKQSSITLFLAAKPSTIAKKRKTQVIVIHADEGPVTAIIGADNTGTKKANHLLDVVFILDGEGLLVSFLLFANPDNVT